jgi:16S rRNA pseudouridine516 synthase
MQSPRTRLDRLISRHAGIKRRDVRLLLAQGRVCVDGDIARMINQVVHQFSHVTLDGQTLQNHQPVYVMMNKPTGVVSATKDKLHTTVVDLINQPDRDDLHIAGRLDFNSSGLLLLTNDGRWSRQLSDPNNNVAKLYRVTVEKPLTDEYVSVFAEGILFSYEGVITRPAGLRIISDHVAEVSLVEGRYHQIKRMFGHFNNKVLTLHRYAVGNLRLDADLAAGQSRTLEKAEVSGIF